MSLRILFADDSMTAQNMGKKILTDAGYEVVAVSNGAAAVKKIAEQKPDIIILDVYMPGYTGLEVCEKVRSSIHTLKTPVLLTVGKMEAYRPEDASRVKADGVIVKPFEASDLLAVIKKLEQKVEKFSEPEAVEQTVLLAPPPIEPLEEFKAEPHEPEPPARAHALVDVPDHMAGTSAFSDLLGGEPAMAAETVAPPVSAEVPVSADVPVEEAPVTESVPQFEVPTGWSTESAPPEVTSAPIPVEAVQEPAALSPDDTQEIPAYTDESSSEVQVVPTAAVTPEVTVEADPALESNASEITRNTVVEHTEPGLETTMQVSEPAVPAALEHGLVTNGADMAAFTTRFGVQDVEDVPVGVASDLPEESFTPVVDLSSGRTPQNSAAAPPPPAPVIHPSMSEDDFKARVAAAMAAYDDAPAPSHSEGNSSGTPQPTSSIEYVAAVVEAENSENHSAVPETPAVSTEAPASFEYTPPVGGTETPAPAAVTQAPAEASPEPVAEPDASGVAGTMVEVPAVDQVNAAVESEVTSAAAAAATETGADHHAIAEVVHRVMERLKPELVNEIVRELKKR